MTRKQCMFPLFLLCLYIFLWIEIKLVENLFIISHSTLLSWISVDGKNRKWWELIDEWINLVKLNDDGWLLNHRRCDGLSRIILIYNCIYSTYCWDLSLVHLCQTWIYLTIDNLDISVSEFIKFNSSNYMFHNLEILLISWWILSKKRCVREFFRRTTQRSY